MDSLRSVLEGNESCRRPPPFTETSEEKYFNEYFIKEEDISKLHPSLAIDTYDCKKGICFIFDHTHYQDNDHRPRPGTECDRYAIKRTFSTMNFTVVTYVDLSKDEIMDKLESFAKLTTHDFDCLLVFVLTHGDNGFVAAYDTMYPLESLFSVFYADKCPKLAGQPKTFIVNACQGDETDIGQEQSKTDVGAIGARIPVTSDIIVALSTADEFLSWRTCAGTWFIQCLITVINENLIRRTNLDVESLFRIVRDRVAVNNEGIDKDGDTVKQQPVNVTSSRKKFYFPTRTLQDK